MACTNSTQFMHVDNIGDELLMSKLETNMKTFLDWGFLGIGGWFDVTRPTSGIYGGVFDNLRAVDDPAYNDGQVWESARKEWVWETGVEYQNSTGIQPISISGVYVNNVLYGTGDATYGHYYNYPLGRVIFNTAISTTSTVEINHSYRWVQVYKADDAPWWRELQYGSFRVDDAQFSLSGSGEWSILAPHRVQLPAVVLECVPRGSSRPYEMGNNTLILEQDMLFHVLAETRHDRNQLVDVLRTQTDRTIWLYDSEDIANSNNSPLDYRGMLVGTKMYPDFVSDYFWEKCYFTNAVISEVQTISPYLYEGTVRMTLEVVVGTF